MIARIALLVVLLLLSGHAAAQSCSHSYTLNNDQCADQGLANIAVWAAANEQIAVYKQGNPNDTRTACFNATGSTSVTIWIRLNGCSSANHKLYTRTFPSGKTCTARPPLGAGWFQTGTGPTCKDGCQYGDSSGGEFTNVTLFPGTPAAVAFRNEQGGQIPSGGLCNNDTEAPKPLTEEQCKTVGTLTQCMMPNGKHCAQASSGKKFCWNPNEAGTKVSDNEGATKSPEGKPNLAPPIPPSNNGQWEQTGSGGTTVNNNGSTTNYTNNTYNSSNGNTGNGGGNTNPDGSENPGEGDGEDDKPNTVAGGSGCGEGAAPTCSGTSCTAEAFASLIQQWRSRCADEDARGEYEGDASSGASNAGGDDEGGTVAGLWDNEGTAPTIDHGKVNIGGGLVIPTVMIFDTSWTVPAEFYDALNIIKFIVIAAFTIAGLVVLWNR